MYRTSNRSKGLPWTGKAAITLIAFALVFTLYTVGSSLRESTVADEPHKTVEYSEPSERQPQDTDSPEGVAPSASSKSKISKERISAQPALAQKATSMKKAARRANPPAMAAGKSGSDKLAAARKMAEDGKRSFLDGPPPPPKEKEALVKRAAVMRGVSAGSIKSSSERWGLAFSGRKKLIDEESGEVLLVDTGYATAADTDVTFSCTLITTNAGRIAAAKFKVDGLAAAGTLPAGAYLDIAEGYLGYFAALPYEGSEPLKATLWIKENMRTVRPGTSKTITIGAVEYRLSADRYTRVLSIRPKK